MAHQNKIAREYDELIIREENQAKTTLENSKTMAIQKRVINTLC